MKIHLKTEVGRLKGREIILFETCVHEAGHAAMAVLLGVPVLDVYVGPGLEGWCQNEYVADPVVDGLITVSGVVAERLFGFSGLLTSSTDAKILKKRWIGSAGKAILEKNARIVLGGYEDRVRALAETLFRKRRLQEKAVERAFWGKGPRPKPLISVVSAFESWR